MKDRATTTLVAKIMPIKAFFFCFFVFGYREKILRHGEEMLMMLLPEEIFILDTQVGPVFSRGSGRIYQECSALVTCTFYENTPSNLPKKLAAATPINNKFT
jgi:hypothetical protein